MAQLQAIDTGSRYTAAMERLVAVVQDLSLARDVATIQAIVRVAARELTGADGAAFVLRDGDQCHYADEDAIGPLWKGQRFPMSNCVSGWAMLNRTMAVIEDIYRDDRIPHDAYRPTFVRSLAMVPIRLRDPLGAIGVYWKQRRRPTDEQLRLLQALADTTAVAMENVAVREQLEERVRSRTAEALAARDRAERADALKTRFLGAANHDLRQPLQALAAYLAAIARGDSLDVRAVAEKARGSVRSMGELLDALLDLDRLQSGAVQPMLADVPLARVAERAVDSSRLPAEGKGLALEVAGPDCTVRTDEALLTRILDNLVSNAVRYTEAGRVAVRWQADGDRVVVTVADTGIGIPAHALDRVFEEWYQLHNPGRDRARGLGLGLSIVRYLAQLLDHPLQVASRPGEGSTFSLTLPRGGPAFARPARPAPSPRAAADPVVLLVEDDPAIVDATCLVLKFAGITVRSAGGHEAALAAIRAGFRPTVLVTDFLLEDGNGLDAIARVRDALREPIPAILMTGDTSIKASQLGEVDHCTLLHKPVDSDRLIDAIRSLAS